MQNYPKSLPIVQHIVQQQKRGLTLMEVMIAIIVFGIGILGVLHVMTQNIGMIDRSKLTTTAIHLTKEAMELAFHHRNTNTLLSYNRSCGERDASANNELGCIDTVASGTTTYLIQTDYEGTYSITPIPISGNFYDKFEASRLYKHTDTTDSYHINWLDHDSDGEPTNFARFLYYEPLQTNDIDNNIKNNLVKITATTLFSKGNSTGQIILESIIGKRE